MDGRPEENLRQRSGRESTLLAEYEKVKRLTIPLGNDHLFVITAEVGCYHNTLITKIQKLHL